MKVLGAYQLYKNNITYNKHVTQYIIPAITEGSRFQIS